MPKQTAKIIDGKTIAEKILLGLKNEISKLKRPPGLAVILIGEDEASKLYVRNKKRACEKVGIIFHSYFCGGEFCPNSTENEILKMIDFLNNDPSIDGIIVQLPIPKKFNVKKIIERISPVKDVDCFTEKNKKKYLAGKKFITSPLILAVEEALKHTDQNLKGKEALIVAKNPTYSEMRKKDLEKLGLKTNITSVNSTLSEKTKKADVLVAILGQSNLIKKSMTKPGAIVIDIGTNLVSEKKWTGDVDPKVAEVASWLTPVPGGIGPLTVAFLLKNTVELAKKNQNEPSK